MQTRTLVPSLAPELRARDLLARSESQLRSQMLQRRFLPFNQTLQAPDCAIDSLVIAV